jgi:hypothetical protein
VTTLDPRGAGRPGGPAPAGPGATAAGRSPAGPGSAVDPARGGAAPPWGVPPAGAVPPAGGAPRPAGPGRVARIRRALAALPARALGVPPGAKSSTGPVLRRLRNLLVAGTAVAFGLAFWAMATMHGALVVAHDEAVPALTALDAASAALRGADGAAAVGFARFTAGQSELVATGPEYQDQLAAANQSLAQVAEFNVAGDKGTLLLQRVQGQLVAYADLVARAQGYYQLGNVRQGAARMWDASHLLYRADEGGVLHGLDELEAEQQRTVGDRARAGWMGWWSIPLWTVPLGLLLALLAGTQLFLRRRLRRTVNLWLLGATVLLTATTAYSAALAVWHVHRGRSDLVQQVRIVPATHLYDLLRVSCDNICGPTVDAATSAEGTPTTLRSRADQPTAPPNGDAVLYLLPATALLVGTLAAVGLQAPVAAYRFEQ